MKKLYINKLIVLFGLGLLTSCVSMQYTSLDVLRPAEVAFKPTATNLLIVNNSVVQPIDYGHKTEFYNENSKNVKQEADSLALFCLSVLSEELTNKEFFNQVDVELSSINKSNDFFVTYALSASEVDSLCQKYNANVLLSLDRIKVNDKIAELYDVNSYSYYMALVARYETRWSVYYPGNPVSQNFTFKDTIYWEAESYQRAKALNSLPYRGDALVDGALYAGKNSINRFVPYWDKSDRYFYYSSNKHLKQGMDSVYVKNWDAAIKIWEEGLVKASNGMKSKLCNNIAVVYEIKGDIDKAVEYAAKSYQYAENNSVVDLDNFMNILKYVDILNVRKNEIELLNKQLGK